MKKLLNITTAIIIITTIVAAFVILVPKDIVEKLIPYKIITVNRLINLTTISWVVVIILGELLIFYIYMKVLKDKLKYTNDKLLAKFMSSLELHNDIDTSKFIEKVISKGFNVNSKYNGKPIINYCVEKKFPITISVLLKYGANMDDVYEDSSNNDYLETEKLKKFNENLNNIINVNELENFTDYFADKL